MLKPVQERAAILYAEGVKGAEIARRLNISYTTYLRYKGLPEFQDRVQSLTKDLTHEALTDIKNNLTKNVAIVQDIATSGGEPGVVPSRLKAAMYLIDKVLKPAEKMGTIDSGVQAREVMMEVQRMSSTDMEELLSRGTDD